MRLHDGAAYPGRARLRLSSARIQLKLQKSRGGLGIGGGMEPHWNQRREIGSNAAMWPAGLDSAQPVLRFCHMGAGFILEGSKLIASGAGVD
ncbi:MAG: hypothetical protein QOF41_2147 [Methylobacteriaceae bacterium]|nr:hypothetical protein [Methylobacteriaceae bacterium]